MSTASPEQSPQPTNISRPNDSKPRQPINKKKSGCGCLLILFILAIVFSLVGKACGSDDAKKATASVAPSASVTAASPSASATASVAPSASVTAASPSASVTAVPVSTPSSDPQQLLDQKVRAALGSGNRDGVERVKSVTDDRGSVIVLWAINENLTDNLTKDGARLDGTNILKALQQSGVKITKATLVGTYSMQDKLGNTSEDTVVNETYSGDTIRKINFDSFLFKNVWDIADDGRVMPAFQ